MSIAAGSSGLCWRTFLRHPRAEPLPGFGPCKVVVCTRQAHARRGLCRAHDVRWWEQHRAGMLAVTDFGAWCRSSAPVASGHEVVLRGLAPLVQAEILFGLQERCRQGALTPLFQLRIICRRLLGIHAPTITGLDVSRLARHHRALAQDLQQAVLRAGTSPQDEQRKDIWNTAVLGHGRRRVIDFTGISQTGSARPSNAGSPRNCRPGGVTMPPRSCKITCTGLRNCRPACGCTAVTTATIPGLWAAATSSRSSAGSRTGRSQARCPRGVIRRPAVRSP